MKVAFMTAPVAASANEAAGNCEAGSNRRIDYREEHETCVS